MLVTQQPLDGETWDVCPWRSHWVAGGRATKSSHQHQMRSPICHYFRSRNTTKYKGHSARERQNGWGGVTRVKVRLKARQGNLPPVKGFNKSTLRS